MTAHGPVTCWMIPVGTVGGFEARRSAPYSCSG